jgi:hypothetical protein
MTALATLTLAQYEELLERAERDGYLKEIGLAREDVRRMPIHGPEGDPREDRFTCVDQVLTYVWRRDMAKQLGLEPRT